MSGEPFRWTRGRIALSVVQCLLLLPIAYALGRGRQYSHATSLGIAISLWIAAGAIALLFVLGVREFGYDFGRNRDRVRTVAAVVLQASSSLL